MWIEKEDCQALPGRRYFFSEAGSDSFFGDASAAPQRGSDLRYAALHDFLRGDLLTIQTFICAIVLSQRGSFQGYSSEKPCEREYVRISARM
jgi:hypothetical protein